MDLKKRVEKLEAILGDTMVSWQLRDGTKVMAYGEDMIDCMISVVEHGRDPSHPTHPLLEKIREGDPSTYTGDDSFFGLINALLKSYEEIEKRKNVPK